MASTRVVISDQYPSGIPDMLTVANVKKFEYPQGIHRVIDPDFAPDSSLDLGPQA